MKDFAGYELSGDNADATREVGHPATRAIKAFADGDYRACVELLRPVRKIAHRFGGSHAQRDLIDLTLIEAATRAGAEELAAALLAERTDATRDIAPAQPLRVRAAVTATA